MFVIPNQTMLGHSRECKYILLKNEFRVGVHTFDGILKLH